MIRSFLSLFLTLAFAAGASAQTTPKTATRSNVATRPPAAKAPKTTANKTASESTLSDTPVSTAGEAQSIYAAPGQPIIVPEGKVGPYDGKAAGRHTTKGGTTLSPR